MLAGLFSCKDDDNPVEPMVKEKLTVEDYFVDEDLKLILSNKDISNIIIEDELNEFLLDEIYTLVEPTNTLEFGTPYLVEKNSETYQLYFTELPILAINSNNAIVDEPKVAATCEFISFGKQEYYNFNLGIEIRGGWAQSFPKKSYGFEIWEDASGNSSSDLSFLNMRNDDDWILDAMYNDPLRMRNLISHRMWNDIHTPHYAALEPDAKATVRSEYVEIFINGKYNGIYALSERPDRKLLKLKKYDGSIRGEMYKGIAWINALFTNIENYDNNSRIWGGFEMEYPSEEEITDWSKVYEFVNFVINSDDQNFIDEISNKIHTSNFIDYFIFLNLMRATDNTGKNVFLAKYDADMPYFYMPWDLDGTWGIQYEGMRDPITDDILTNGLYERLWNLNPNNFQNTVKDRWSDLKNNEFSVTNLMEYFEKEKELLRKNSVYEREKMSWDFEYQEDDYIYMSNWMNDRWEYLNDFFQ